MGACLALGDPSSESSVKEGGVKERDLDAADAAAASTRIARVSSISTTNNEKKKMMRRQLKSFHFFFLTFPEPVIKENRG